MADNLKARIGSKAGAVRKKAGKAVRASGIMRFLPGSDELKLIVKGVAAVAALLSLLLLVITGADLRPSALLHGFRDKRAYTHASGEGFPVDIPGGRIFTVSTLSRGTAMLTRTKCMVLDGRGRRVMSENHSLASPAMESDGRYILLYDSLGQDYTVRTVSEEIYKGETDASIICADISRSGRYAFVTKSETNNAKLMVCSPDGKVLHKWKSVNYKISDVSLSPSGKYVALCGLSANDGVLESTVILQKVGGKENLKEFKFQNTLIADIAFDGDSRIVAVGDDLAAYISLHDDKNNKIYGYDGRSLNSYDISSEGELAMVFSDHSDGRNASVVVIDHDGRERAHIDTDLTSPYVDLEDGRINLLCNSEVVSYNFKGKLLGKAEVQADCQSVLTSQGRLLARGVMYLSEIE